MIQNIWNEVLSGKEIRRNLIQIKEELKKDTEDGLNAEQQLEQQFIESGDSVIDSLLHHEDAKVRKNMALILGLLVSDRFLPMLWKAYCDEDTLFVRSAYLEALAGYDYRKFLPEMKKVLLMLEQEDTAVENHKHRSEEIRRLHELVRDDNENQHVFTGYRLPAEVVLLTNRNHIYCTMEKLHGQKCKEFNAGVIVQTTSLEKVLPIRTYEEILFIIPGLSNCPNECNEAAKAIVSSRLLLFLQERHKGEGPFFFRLEIKGQADLEKRAVFTKQLASQIEEESKRTLINSTGRYELEIRLIESRSGQYNVLVKLFTFPDERFSYRQETTPFDIRPVNAALAMELASEYLREDAQVLDPFCNAGTMLVERSRFGPVGTLYALDVYPDAIKKAEINFTAAELTVNLIQRDFASFQHEYQFDEIITNMPVARGKRTEDEIWTIYQQFFNKAKEILAEDGIMILYSHNKKMVEKLGNCKPFCIIRDYEISMKEKTYVFIIRFCNAA